MSAQAFMRASADKSAAVGQLSVRCRARRHNHDHDIGIGVEARPFLNGGIEGGEGWPGRLDELVAAGRGAA